MDESSKLARARVRYERMGWSSAKIERALEGRSRTPRRPFGLHPAIVDLLRSIVRDCGSAAVWVHEFAGDAEVEPYVIARRERWAWPDVPARAAMLVTDTLAEIDGQQAPTRER